MAKLVRRLARSLWPFHRRGRLLTEGAIDSRLFGRRMAFATLSPPPPHDANRDLPVVLVLHGLGDDHLALDDFGIAARLHVAMESSALPPFHAIAPDGERGFWIDWHDGSRPYERFLLEELLPAAERGLGVDATRERRHVIGVSMGGIGALQGWPAQRSSMAPSGCQNWSFSCWTAGMLGVSSCGSWPSRDGTLAIGDDGEPVSHST